MPFVLKNKNIFLGIALMSATFLAYAPCLNAGFLGNWDDAAHLLENPHVRGLSLEHLRAMFTSNVNRTYIPLTILSFALEYRFFELEPWIYHFNNILLHVMVSLGVFVFARQVGLSARGSFLAGLLFGIHPMHVESVAWVTERKDVLYAVFYIAALNAYWRFLRNEKAFFYLLTFVSGLLSMLAKPMALSLPLVLLACDWLAGRQMDRYVFFEKAAFLLYIIPIGWQTYSMHMRLPALTTGPGILLWIWSLIFYVLKFCFPFNLIPQYHVPQPVTFLNFNFAFPVLLLLMIVYGLYRWRRQRLLLFACLFYFLSVFFLLRYDFQADLCFVADRFMYLPLAGFCLLAGAALGRLLNWSAGQKKEFKMMLWAVVVVLFSGLFFKTFLQSRLWIDPETLWSYVIEKNPESYVAHINRGCAYAQNGMDALALKDFNRAVDIAPHIATAYYDCGVVFQDGRRYHQALENYNRAIDIDSQYANAYNNRAIVLSLLGYYVSAIQDCSRVIALKPHDPSGYYNRGWIFKKLKLFQQAEQDFRRAKSLGYP